jgi:hydrogenase-4 membrane subunit HyfE
VTDARRRWTPDDVGVVVTGVAAFGLGLLPWFEAVMPDGARLRFDAWDLGLSGFLPVLLALYAALRVVWLAFRPLKPEVPLAPGVEPLIASLLALALMTYRSLDVPTVPLAAVGRTVWLSAALAVVFLQALCAARTVKRTGLRAA